MPPMNLEVFAALKLEDILNHGVKNMVQLLEGGLGRARNDAYKDCLLASESFGRRIVEDREVNRTGRVLSSLVRCEPE